MCHCVASSQNGHARLGRLASSSSIVGIATIPQCPRSPRNQPRNTRIALPPGWPPSRPPSSEEFPSDGRCWARPTICLGRAGDACVLGAVERVGNTLYGARVDVELGGCFAHAHAARQSRPDSLSQLVRDRRPAKALTFTLGPP